MSTSELNLESDRTSTSGEQRRDVVIVGAGPAGLCAAAYLAEVGVSSVVVEEAPHIGGQISRRRHDKGFDPADYPWARPYRRLLSKALESPHVELRTATTVWSIDKLKDEPRSSITFDSPPDPAGDTPDEAGPSLFRINLANEGTQAGSVVCRYVLLATGAYDAPLPVEGWTLPGVVGLGSLQTIAKTDGLPPSSRVVLYGTHPLNLISAAEVVRQGHEVAEVILPQSVPELLADALKFGANPVAATIKLPQLIGALGVLMRARVPVRFYRRLAKVSGADNRKELHLQRWGDLGSTGTSRLDCDVLAIGGGFLASTELLRSLGCATQWDFDRGGWIADHDETMRTSEANIYAAGEVCGVAGAESSASQGVVAGHSIAVRLGVVPKGAAATVARKGQRRARMWARFGVRMAHFGATARARVVAAVTENTEICRCEAVTVGCVNSVWKKYRSLIGLRDVKMITRLGMGHCQARYCGPLINQIYPYGFDRDGGRTVGTVPRTPVKPLRVAELHDGDHR